MTLFTVLHDKLLPVAILGSPLWGVVQQRQAQPLRK